MKIRITFTDEESKLLKDGYEYIQHRKLDEEQGTVRYDSISDYINAGRKVKRRRAIGDFFEKWGSALIWILFIGIILVWSTISSNQSSSSHNTSDYEHSSTSGIYQDNTCAITTCNDGSCSTSTGRGTCSYHGGIRD